MSSAKIAFEGSLGQNLDAKLDMPIGEVKSYALFAHCFTGGKDFSAVNRISKALNDEGIALFRFDFTGLGNSEGDFANTNFSSNIEDLLCAANYMTEYLAPPSIMIGHSLGGTASLLSSLKIPEVKAVCIIGAPSNTVNVLKHFKDDLTKIELEGEAVVELAGRKFKIKKQFIEDAKEQRVLEAIDKYHKPLLIMHSPLDETVNISHAKKIYEKAHHPKSFISLGDADHLLMKKPSDAAYVAKVLAAWASRYVL